MEIRPGDTFQAMVRSRNEEDDGDQPRRVTGHRMTILSVDGDDVTYQRVGSTPSHTTLRILLASIERGDLVPAETAGDSACK